VESCNSGEKEERGAYLRAGQWFNHINWEGGPKESIQRVCGGGGARIEGGLTNVLVGCTPPDTWRNFRIPRNRAEGGPYQEGVMLKSKKKTGKGEKGRRGDSGGKWAVQEG